MTEDIDVIEIDCGRVTEGKMPTEAQKAWNTYYKVIKDTSAKRKALKAAIVKATADYEAYVKSEYKKERAEALALYEKTRTELAAKRKDKKTTEESERLEKKNQRKAIKAEREASRKAEAKKLVEETVKKATAKQKAKKAATKPKLAKAPAKKIEVVESTVDPNTEAEVNTIVDGVLDEI